MPDLPHSTDVVLAQMWRRIYRFIEQTVQAQIIATFGQSWRGGSLSGGSISGTIPLTSLPGHHTTHETGGSDAITGTVDGNARVAVGKNSAATTGTRRKLNLIEGSNITLTVADNAGSERVDVTIAGSAAGGTVTSVGLSMPAEFSVSGSPVTSSGTLAVTKATEAANTVWAGPTSGAAAAPTFRALVAADVTPAALPSSLLVLLPTPWNFVDDSGADNGQPVDFVTLSSGDVIGVYGM